MDVQTKRKILNVKTKRKYFITVEAILGIIVQAMVLITSIPNVGSTVAVIVVDGFSILNDFYQAKNGRKKFNKKMMEKICDFRMMKNFVLCTVSMALSIAAIVTGDSKLQVRMVLIEWSDSDWSCSVPNISDEGQLNNAATV